MKLSIPKFTYLPPKKKNRWLLTFPPEFQIQQWMVKKTQLPSCKIIDKKIIWNPIVVTILDNYISDNINKIIDSFYGSYDSDLDNLIQNGFNCRLETLNETGEVIDDYFIGDCEITNISYGDLDVNDSGTIKIEIIIQPKTIKKIK